MSLIFHMMYLALKQTDAGIERQDRIPKKETQQNFQIMKISSINL